MKLKLLTFFFVVLIVAGTGWWFGAEKNMVVRTESVPPSASVEEFTNQTISKETRNEATPPVAENKETNQVAPTKKVCVGAEQVDFLCWDALLRDMVKTENVAGAFAFLRAEYDKNPYVRSQCHPLSHVIGRAAVARFPKVSEAYQNGDSFCWSGYYHGVMEGILGTMGQAAVTDHINDVCVDLSKEKKYSFDHYNCVHGLGHGVMVLTNNELFDALALCENVTDSWERSSCVSGVFMENIIIDNKNHFTKYLKPADPAYPCTAVKQEHKATCWLMQTSYMLKVTGTDFAKVFSLCAAVEPDYVNICYQSLGRDASGQSLSIPESTKAKCDLGTTKDQKSNCIIGAVKDFISYHHSDTEAKRFCALYDDEALRTTCLSTAEGYMTIL